MIPRGIVGAKRAENHAGSVGSVADGDAVARAVDRSLRLDHADVHFPSLLRHFLLASRPRGGRQARGEHRGEQEKLKKDPGESLHLDRWLGLDLRTEKHRLVRKLFAAVIDGSSTKVVKGDTMRGERKGFSYGVLTIIESLNADEICGARCIAGRRASRFWINHCPVSIIGIRK